MSEAPTPCRARGRHSKHIFFCGSHPPPQKKNTPIPRSGCWFQMKMLRHVRRHRAGEPQRRPGPHSVPSGAPASGPVTGLRE